MLTQGNVRVITVFRPLPPALPGLGAARSWGRPQSQGPLAASEDILPCFWFNTYSFIRPNTELPVSEWKFLEI